MQDFTSNTANTSAQPAVLREFLTFRLGHEDYAIELSLLEIGDYIAEHDLGRFDVIEAIRSHDARHQTDFMTTLRAYLDTGGNIAQTAKRLHVHGNTIRYRIARLADDFQVDLEQPAARLWLWLRLASQRD